MGVRLDGKGVLGSAAPGSAIRSGGRGSAGCALRRGLAAVGLLVIRRRLVPGAALEAAYV